jgi:hypothetical protein
MKRAHLVNQFIDLQATVVGGDEEDEDEDEDDGASAGFSYSVPV